MTSSSDRSAAKVDVIGVIGIAAAVSLVPVAVFVGSPWWVLSLGIVMAALSYLWRPA